MPQLHDLIQQQFGRLTVIERAPNHGKQVAWRCRCECGGDVVVDGIRLTRGVTKSCGCLRRETAHAQRNKRTHGLTGSTTYRAWRQMKARCLNVRHPAYPDYGERGITVCTRWLESFENFLADMGYKPDGLTLERRNNDGPYSPDNCYWATWMQQAQNRRSTRLATFAGETLCFAEWARRVGLSCSVFAGRIRRGWSMDRALATPLQVPTRASYQEMGRRGAAVKWAR